MTDCLNANSKAVNAGNFVTVGCLDIMKKLIKYPTVG